MRVLIACEFSGTVRDEFAALGHDAWSCDILPTEKPGNHIIGDVRHIINQPWDLMIAHPPCTYLSNSGVCWLHKDQSRWDRLDEAAEFFKALMYARIPRVAVENPIQHKYARARIGLKQSQVIQPYHFGHKEQKATCLWLRGLPLLKHRTDLKAQTMALPNRERQRLHYLPQTEDRAKLRAVTYPGIAKAMAKQWGKE